MYKSYWELRCSVFILILLDCILATRVLLVSVLVIILSFHKALQWARAVREVSNFYRRDGVVAFFCCWVYVICVGTMISGIHVPCTWPARNSGNYFGHNLGTLNRQVEQLLPSSDAQTFHVPTLQIFSLSIVNKNG